MCLGSSVYGQVKLSTNLLHTIPLQKPVIFEVRISKANISNFTRFQMDVPAGVAVESVENRNGTFSFEEQKVKIIWVTAPVESEFSVRLKIISPKNKSNSIFTFHYFYVEENLKKEWVSENYFVTFKDTVLPPLLSAPMIDLNEKGGSNLTVANSNLRVKEPVQGNEQIRRQVEQLRKDARESKSVGEREKRMAEERLQTVHADEKRWASRAAGTEKTAELQRIKREKVKAEEDLLVAKRVLALAETLDSNANEIEKINRQLNPAMYTGASVKNKSNYVVKPSPVKKGLTYRVQVGAFKEQPSKSKFSLLGKVSVIHEGAVYKVMIGDFSEKDDAYKLRDQLNARYPGGFIVKFVDEQPVK